MDRDPTRGRTAPNRCWTLTNMQEATPDVMTPLCWSTWNLGELGARRAWHQIGLLPKSMVYPPTDPNECAMAPFFGRQALNVDMLATYMGALPGTSRSDVERQMMGTVRAGDDQPDDRAPRGRPPFVAVKAPRVLRIQDRRVSALYPAHLAAWRRDVLGRTALSGRDLLVQSRARFLEVITVHGTCRFLSQALQGALTGLAEAAGRPELVTSVYAGFGEVTETSIAEDLWALSRGEIDETVFLSKHGFHGRHEGNIPGVPWRLDPEPIRSMAKALAMRPDAERPRVREQAAIVRRIEAMAELRAALPRSRRPLVGLLVRLAGDQIRCMERTKAGMLMAIDGTRAAASLLGAELVAKGRLARPDDAMFFTAEELLGELPADATELAAFRRARRDEYRTFTIPTMFVGMPEPSVVDEEVSDERVLTGAAGSAGTVTGRARVIVDLDDAGTLEQGEILVCRHTDPAWVAAMALADALVVDIGAPSSHGAIVARELNIPCVIGTAVGTRQIRTGDLIRVDGTAGQVEIVERG